MSKEKNDSFSSYVEKMEKEEKEGESKKVALNRVKDANLHKYVDDSEEVLSILVNRQRKAYEKAMGDRNIRTLLSLND